MLINPIISHVSVAIALPSTIFPLGCMFFPSEMLVFFRSNQFITQWWRPLLLQKLFFQAE